MQLGPGQGPRVFGDSVIKSQVTIYKYVLKFPIFEDNLVDIKPIFMIIYMGNESIARALLLWRAQNVTLIA